MENFSLTHLSLFNSKKDILLDFLFRHPKGYVSFLGFRLRLDLLQDTLTVLLWKPKFAIMSPLACPMSQSVIRNPTECNHSEIKTDKATRRQNSLLEVKLIPYVPVCPSVVGWSVIISIPMLLSKHLLYEGNIAMISTATKQSKFGLPLTAETRNIMSIFLCILKVYNLSTSTKP